MTEATLVEGEGARLRDAAEVEGQSEEENASVPPTHEASSVVAPPSQFSHLFPAHLYLKERKTGG